MNTPTRFLVAIPFLAASTPGFSQDLAAPVVSAPTGYDVMPDPFSGSAMTEGLEAVARRFSFGLSSSMVYDTNFFQAPNGAQDDTTFTVSPFVAFRTQGSEFTLGARAALNYNTYFENSDLNGLGYNLGLDASYSGGPLTANISIGTDETQGANRYYGGNFVETNSFNTALGASYRWSPKTSFDARFGYHWTEPDQNGFGGTETTNFDIAAMWQATPLVRIGPGIAWTSVTGDLQGDRQTVGPMIRGSYQLGKKVSLDGTLNLEFADYSGAGGSDTDISGSLGIAYRPSIMWGMNLSLYQGTTADGSAIGSYRETTSLTLGYNRRILRSSLNLGLTYSMDESSTPNGFGPGSTDYLSFNTSLGMPILSDRANVSVFYSWRQQSGNPLQEWSGHQFGLSISSNF
jgi:hypothetical protein